MKSQVSRIVRSWNYSPVDMVQHPRRSESPDTPLPETQVSHGTDCHYTTDACVLLDMDFERVFILKLVYCERNFGPKLAHFAPKLAAYCSKKKIKYS